jgi:hypothetical protein
MKESLVNTIADRRLLVVTSLVEAALPMAATEGK